jgi:hypothetical protein
MGYLALAKSFLDRQHTEAGANAATCEEPAIVGPADSRKTMTSDERNEINEETPWTVSAASPTIGVSEAPDRPLGGFQWDDGPPQSALPVVPRAATKSNAHTRELVEWFGRYKPTLSGGPFILRPGHRVFDPSRFYASLQADIDSGPGGVRARRGALADDLADLRQIVGGSNEPVRGGRTQR